MSKLQVPSVDAEERKISLGNKRKLMPLRNRSAVDWCGSPIGDFDPQEKEKMACPYAASEPVGHQRVGNKPAVGKGSQMCKGASEPEPRCRTLARKCNKDNRRPRPRARKIVCTFMHRKDVDWVREAIGKLGKCELEMNVTATTTHVVCGEEKRTINFMCGIAYGCWILTHNWVKESVNAGHWLDEEQFEVKTFPAVRQCRVARETLGIQNSIFNNGDMYYVARDTSPPYCELLKLLQLCGAKISTSAKRANVVVSSATINPPPGSVEVNEKWVLDSIVQNMLQQKSNYFH